MLFDRYRWEDNGDDANDYTNDDNDCADVMTIITIFIVIINTGIAIFFYNSNFYHFYHKKKSFGISAAIVFTQFDRSDSSINSNKHK